MTWLHRAVAALEWLSIAAAVIAAPAVIAFGLVE